MEELIKIEVNENQEPVISGRVLHEFLEVKEKYTQWFERMKEYGFTENVDFTSLSDISEKPQGGRPLVDHAIKLDMAKELAMIQRTDKGKQARQYFIQIEKYYNSPEKIMARALQIAEKELSNLRLENKVQEQQIAELKPKASYYDLVLQCKDLLRMTEIAKDYGMSARGMNKLLHDLEVQYRQSGIWFLYSKYQDKGYTQTKTQNYSKPDGTQGVTTHTYWTQKGRLFLYELLKDNGMLPMIEIEAA
jgi:antA/antB antirepressor domain protein